MMHKSAVLLLLLFGLYTTNAVADHEASVNLDRVNVEPFLTRLNDSLNLKLNVGRIVEFTNDVEFDEEEAIEIRATFKGSTVILEYGVYMDDYDSPDIYFYSANKELIEAIRVEMNEFVQDRAHK